MMHLAELGQLEKIAIFNALLSTVVQSFFLNGQQLVVEGLVGNELHVLVKNRCSWVESRIKEHESIERLHDRQAGQHILSIERVRLLLELFSNYNDMVITDTELVED